MYLCPLPVLVSKATNRVVSIKETCLLSVKQCSILHSGSFIIDLLTIKLLESNKIEYIHQKTFPTCIFPSTKAKLKFDFYIPQENYLIEFDGE